MVLVGRADVSYVVIPGSNLIFTFVSLVSCVKANLS